MQLTPYYRDYTLAWEVDPEEQRRLRRSWAWPVADADSWRGAAIDSSAEETASNEAVA